MPDPFMLFFLVWLPLAFFSMGAALIPAVGRIWFAAFCSWWWPFREDTAATLLALALDADEDADQWRRHGYEQRRLSSTALSAEIETGFDGDVKLSVHGMAVPLTAWDDFKLGMAIFRWHGRRDDKDREIADRRASATIKDVFQRRRKSERTGA
jgi:hypothetical protein